MEKDEGLFFSSSGERTMSSFFLSAPLPFLPPFYFFLFSAFPLIRLARRKSGGEHTRFKSPFTKVERDAWRREGPLVKDKPSSFAVRPCFPRRRRRHGTKVDREEKVYLRGSLEATSLHLHLLPLSCSEEVEEDILHWWLARLKFCPGEVHPFSL